MKKIFLVIFFIAPLIFFSIAFAQMPEITNGLNYLTTTQNPDGSWGDETSSTEPLPATTSVIETLQTLNETSSQNYTDAVSWLQAQTLETTDYLAERIHALSDGGTDKDVLLSYLDDLTGAWGGYLEFEVNILDTCLTLLALKEINDPDLETISYALFYLTYNQNTDGGFGFFPENESNVYITALVLKVLSLYNDTFDLQAEIDNAVAYLLTMQNVDGSFGEGIVYESALAFDALIASGADLSTVAQPATDYLLTNQLANGSWDDDPYSTALALRTLASVKPNLTISSSDITFSNPTPTVGETITITATIHNTGIADSENVLVQFYDGDPDSGGVFIDETTISSIPAFGNSQASIIWTIPTASTQIIFVKIDPLNSIDELDETDNTATSQIMVYEKADLTIENITFVPEFPVSALDLDVHVNVLNNGGATANNAVINLSLDNGTNINQTISNIQGLESQTLTFNLGSLSNGTYQATATADPDNLITEGDETNNVLTQTFEVKDRIDLVVSHSSIYLSNDRPKEGETLYISAHIYNAGESTASNVLVRFYEGDPGAGGVQLGDDQIIPTIPGSGAVLTGSISYDTHGKSGVHTLYSVVDPLNTIEETDEINNIASIDFDVQERADYILQEIQFVPEFPEEGDIVQIKAVIKNIGTLKPDKVSYLKLYFGDPLAGGEQIGSDYRVYLINPDATEVSTSVAFNTADKVGDNEIYAVVDVFDDVDEISETNNTLSRTLTVSDVSRPDLTLTSNDISFNPEMPAIDDLITISSQITNLKNFPASGVEIKFFDGNPSGGGILLGSSLISSISGMGTGSAEITWGVTGIKGKHEIYVVIDQDNTIAEANEQNNEASTSIMIRLPQEAAPQNLTAIPISLTDIELNWQPSPEEVNYGIVGYNIYRNNIWVNDMKNKEIATEGTASASASQGAGYGPENAIDRNSYTAWRTPYRSELPQWWQVEFLSERKIKQMVISWFPGSHSKDYEIQTWDGAQWITQVTVAGNNEYFTVHNIPETVVTGKVRINITAGNDYNYAGVIKEVYIYEDPTFEGLIYQDTGLGEGSYTYYVTAVDINGVESLPSNEATALLDQSSPPAPPTGLSTIVNGFDIDLSWNANTEPDLAGYRVYRSGVNVARRERGAVIFGSNGVFHEFAIDGNRGVVGGGMILFAASTQWNTTPPGTMTVILPEVYEIDRLRMYLYEYSSNFSRYKIESSVDGQNWQMAVDKTSGEWRGMQEEIFDQPIQAKYFRITGTLYSGDNTFRLPEFEAYSPEIGQMTFDTYTGLGNFYVKNYSNMYEYTRDVPTSTRLPRRFFFAKFDTEEKDVLYIYDRDTDLLLASYSGNLGSFVTPPLTAANYRFQFIADIEGTASGFTVLSYLTPDKQIATTYLDTVYENGIYQYAVTAIDTDGYESGFSNIATAAIADTTLPAVPANLTAVAGDGIVEISWTENTEPDLMGYNLYRNSETTPLNGSALILKNFYDDLDVIDLVTYTYQITAVDVNGNESEKSAPVSATITGIDLTISEYDLSFRPRFPSAFDDITIFAMVHNTGPKAIQTSSLLTFYAGDPSSGGIEIGSQTVQPLASGEAAMVNFIWNPADYVGVNTVYVYIDSDDAIPELNETNNVASFEIIVNPEPDLSVNVASVDSTSFPEISTFVRVGSWSGEGIFNLTEENFIIKEDGTDEKPITVELLNSATHKPIVDIVFVLDDTWSMHDALDVVKEQILDFVNGLKESNLDYMLGLVTFKDDYTIYNDGYLTGNDITFTTWINDIVAGGGGDMPEDSLDALEAATTIQFRLDTQKVFILFTDVQPHVFGDGTPYAENTVESIKQKLLEAGVVTFIVGPYYWPYSLTTSEGIYFGAGSITEATGGKFYYIYSGIASIIDELAVDIANLLGDYKITYITHNQNRDGTLRNIDLTATYRYVSGSDSGQYRAPLDKIPDLAVNSLTLSNDAPLPGETVSLTAVIQNFGGLEAKDAVVRFYDGEPSYGTQIGSDQIISSLLPSGITAFTVQWFATAGTHDIYVVVDPLNAIDESNENNNEAFRTITVPGNELPELGINSNDIVFSRPNPVKGESITINATIHNTGADASDILVLTYFGDPLNGGVQIGSSTIQALLSNSTAAIQAQLLVDKPAGPYDIYIWIDPFNTIPEGDEDDNIAFNTITVREKEIYVEVTTDSLQYQKNSDVGITVTVEDASPSSSSWIGDVYIEDQAGNMVAQVASFTENDLEAVTTTGWIYRVPANVTSSWDMKDTLSEVTVDFVSVFQALGIADKTLDNNSIRVYEVDDIGNIIGEKQARADFQTETTANVIWLMDDITIENQIRYFYIYFKTMDSGGSEPSANTNLPVSGKLIAYSDDRGRVHIVKNNGDGTFGEPVMIDDVTISYYDNTQGIELNDFNNDGFIDIVTGSGATGEVFYYQNTADGSNTFAPKVVIGSLPDFGYTSSGYLYAIASADFNNDGNKDFIVSEKSYNQTYIFEGNGDGTFLQSQISLQGYNIFKAKAAADFDGDGNMDLIFTDFYLRILVLKGNGDGTFQPAVIIYSTGISNYGLVYGDFDEDGISDLVTSGYRDAFFIKGKTDGSFETHSVIETIEINDLTAFESGDFNNDGHLDIIAATYTGNTIDFYSGNGDGTFGQKTIIASTINPYYPLGISSSPALPEAHAVPGTPEMIIPKAVNFIWNTSNTPPGNYKVHVTLSEGQGVIAEDYASFEILPDIVVESKVVTDKIAYNVNDPVTITSTVTSLSENTIFENLSAIITVTDSLGTALYTETNTIPLLVPGQMKTFNTYWNTSTNPSGNYPVILEVKDSAGTVLSTSTKNLTISSTVDPSKLLIGQISVDKQSLLQGDNVNIDYSITNVGNIDLSQVDLSIPIVHVVELTPYDTLTDQTSLLMGGTYTNTQPQGTQAYSAKDYLVILRASISGNEETLASTYFRVEGMPSAPSLNWPANGEDIETLTPELIVNNASDPNDDDLTYEFELYSDNTLSNLLSSSEMIAEGEGTTSWSVPLELEENAIYYWRTRAFDGLLYGDWMTPAEFRVNLINDPPTAPTLSSPADSSEVDTFTPDLIVNNASDPDSDNLTYNFELALDMDFTQIISSEIGIFEGDGTTSWQAPVSLSENTYYYWRAQADDWLTEGPWMTTAGFFVNTANDAPTAPVIISPLNDSEITTLSADITASNSTDPDNDPLTYVFEIDTVNTFDSPDMINSGAISEGAGTTSWYADGFTDNTYYYVRAKADDGLAQSPWSEVTGFFVNTVNEAPATPILANPSNGGAVNVFMPELSVHNSSDIDRDVLTYEFEIYGNEAMTVLTASASGVEETPDITIWTVSVNLIENNTYFWRARAFDGELYSGWMPLASFMVNTANDAPAAPILDSPADGSTVDTLNPLLSVYNAVDPDSDFLTYDFEIYADSVLVQSITGIPENASGITSITLAEALSDNTIYTWRARAYDGDRYGAWMNMAEFSVHLPVVNITGTIDFDPNTLNKKSKGKWVVVYIELPEGYDVADIVVSSVILEGVIPVEPWPYNVGDEDNDGIPDLMVKFRRADVIAILPNGDNVIVNVTGTVGAVTFEGFDIIRVIN